MKKRDMKMFLKDIQKFSMHINLLFNSFIAKEAMHPKEKRLFSQPSHKVKMPFKMF